MNFQFERNRQMTSSILHSTESDNYVTVNPALFHDFSPNCPGPGVRFTFYNFCFFTVGFEPFCSLFVST